MLQLHALRARTCRVPLLQASGRILAREIRADRDVPPFDRAAVDGFAIRLAAPWEDGNSFRLLGRLAAGEIRRRPIPPGCAVQVMTGAPVPAGADGVIMVERSETAGDRVRLFGEFAPSIPRAGIAERGHDARRGKAVLDARVRLGAPQIAVLAALGVVEAPVYRLPRVAVLTTGGETVQPEAHPRPWEIRNSNRPMLQSLLSRSDAAELTTVGSSPDVLLTLRRAIRRAASGAQVLVLTGGVSAGEFDLVPEALALEGYRIRFHRVAIRPGKPLLFGTAPGGKAAFGLPGNPVSALVTAWEFLLPYLRAAAGWEDPGPESIFAESPRSLERKPGLTHFILGRLERRAEGWLVHEVPSNGSGDYLSAAHADCLVPLSASERPRIAAGDTCEVHPLMVL